MMMFESEIGIEVERRLIQAIDNRAGAGLPAVSHDILRAIVRADLRKELDAKRSDGVRQKPLPTTQAPVTPVAKPNVPQPIKPKPVVSKAVVLRENASAMYMRLMEASGNSEPVLPSHVAQRSAPTKRPVRSEVSAGEEAAQAIFDAMRRVRGRG